MGSNSALINTMRFNFLYVDQYSFSKTWVYPKTVIPYNMLRFIVDGKSEFCIDDKIVMADKGKVIYIPEGCELSSRTVDGTFTFISVRFTTSVRYEGADFLKDYFNFPTVSEADERIEQYFKAIYQWAKADTRSKMFHIRGNLELIIGAILEQSKDTVLNENYGDGNTVDFEVIKNREKRSNVKADPRIQAIIDYISLHPTEKYSSRKLCEMAELGETAFRKLFKRHTGKAPNEYIRDMRLTTAARLLLVSNNQVNDIAYEVGFEDPNHFIRVFKKAFGYTPNQYRSNALQ